MKNILIFLVLLLATPVAQAADVSVYLSRRQESTVTVLTLNAVVTSPINALEGKILVPELIAERFQWDDSDSPIRMWIKAPAVSEGVISFAGIIPGGLATTLGSPIPLLRVYLRVNSGVDVPDATLTDLSAYLHQQVPQLADVDIRRDMLFEDSTGKLEQNNYDLESLNIELVISRFAEIASGAPVAIFATTSRGKIPGGVMIRERFLGIFGLWKIAQSPYILSDTHGLSAVDLRVSTPSGIRVVTEIPMRLYVLWSILGAVLIYTFLRKVF